MLGATDTGRNAGPLPPAPCPFWAQCGGQLVSRAPGGSPLHAPGPGLFPAVASLGASAQPLLCLCGVCRGLLDVLRALRVTRSHSQEETGAWRLGRTVGEGQSRQRSQPVPHDHPPGVSRG